MCGRTCLTLQPSDIQCACKYKLVLSSSLPGHEKEKLPNWRQEFNCGRKYEPSYNICPTDITPVLISPDHFDEEDKSQTRMLVPMMWGMIPFWHKGDYKKHALTTNNCRMEHMLESKLYKRPFFKGQRCVILCEGFYEWQTTKSTKPSERAAYFLYMTQSDGVKIHDKKTWTANKVNLLKMAGLFDVWEDQNGDKMYSYSIITYESNNVLSWLHHRMPAVLENDEQVSNWLDFKKITKEEALAILKPITKLCWYQISNIVNNSRNKSNKCNKPIADIKHDASSWAPKSKIMQSWLNIRKRKEEKIKKELSDSDDENEEKFNKRMKYSKNRKNSDETTETETDQEVQKNTEIVQGGKKD